MKKKFSLKTQILLILVVFILIVLGMVYFFQTSFLDDFYKASKIRILEDISNKISESINTDDFDTALEQYSFSNEVCVRVVSSEGDLGSESRVNACALSNIDDSMINQIYRETNANDGVKLFTNFKFRMTKVDLQDIYIYAKVVEYGDENALVLVSSLITPLGATISTIKTQYIGIIFIVLVATIILAFALSMTILKPINNISREINHLPNGQYNKDNVKCDSKEVDDLNENLARANEQIIKAEKAKRDLLANVSHDLRTPLTMIQGYGEMIKDLPDQDNKENAEVIIEESKRLSNLVNDLIDYSHLEDGKLNLNKEDVSLNTFLKDIHKQYSSYFKEKKVKFKLELIEDKIVCVDKKRIAQVIYNLLNNAYNYNSKNKKEITLGVEKHDSVYRVYVLDNGDGIKEEDKQLIFDRYYRVDKEHVRSTNGSGIGLALTREILKAHELNYGVDSVVDEYSKFYFDL